MEMTKKKFENLVNDHIEWMKRIDEVEDVLNCDIIESDWVSYPDKLFNNVLEFFFDENGLDIIYWYVYDKRYNPELTLKDSNGNIIPTETVSDLWNAVKDHLI